jgi:transcriptional antiterminator NusG
MRNVLSGGGRKYYAARVRDRGEEAFIKLFYRTHPDIRGTSNIYFPKRKMREKKAGKTAVTERPVFSGYVFFEIGAEDSVVRHCEAAKSVKGFYRFLHSNADIAEITGRDLDIILRFIKLKDATAGVSKVFFDENSRIVVTDGALKGLEGHIVRVDRRRGRAKVRLGLYGDSFLVDFSFEAIAPDGGVREGEK